MKTRLFVIACADERVLSAFLLLLLKSLSCFFGVIPITDSCQPSKYATEPRSLVQMTMMLKPETIEHSTE